ncbi:MAG TPA: chaperonin GroEL [Chloroflexota bacterium]|nr:chaperonin GroEL [Chloroflexota bacterium]
MSTEYVMLAPKSRAAFMRGMGVMTRALRGTLGPAARKVAIMPIIGNNKSPELLDSGATIARRILEIPRWSEDMGAMLIRHLAWRMTEEVGDGATTAAVLTHAIATQANKYIAAGGNAQRIRVGLERARDVVLEELDKQKIVLDDPQEVGRLAAAATGDPRIGELIAEIFDVVGMEGVIIVENAPYTHVDREYVEGMQWDKGYFSGWFCDQGRDDVTLENARVLVTDNTISKMSEILPVVEKVVAAGEKALFIVAHEVQGEALSLLVVNKQKDILHSCAVKSPGYGDRKIRILEDVASLTGARFFSSDAGEKVANASLEDLGRVRRAWANRDFFSLVGGLGDPAELRKRINQLKKEIPTIKDDYERGKARERLGKLVGGVALLKIGAATESERDEKKLRAEAAVAVTRVAIEDGVVIGGGMAYLACIPALKKMDLDGDVGYGVKVLIRALEEPLRCIVENAGLEASPILGKARELQPGYGYDVLQEQYVDMREAGIMDPLKVVRTALSSAVSAAVMAITTEVLVHRPKERDKNVAVNP